MMSVKGWVSALAVCSMGLHAGAQGSETIYLWGGADEERTPPPMETKGGTTRIQEVFDPALLVFAPEESKRNGAAVVICPGGAYNILAVDKEGYEIAEWLKTLGYTAFVLQYSVPQKRDEALKDIQRAVRIVHSRSAEWGIDPEKIGVMGFSAGGSLCARLCSSYAEDQYEPQDKTDLLNSRPAFAVLIYPAYLDLGENRSLTPELHLDDQTPPMFLFTAADDPYGNSAIVMAGALRDAKVPVEMHLVPFGGHGYGLREGNPAAAVWPGLAEVWLNTTVLAEE